MELQNFTITKRDGKKDLFSLDKIMNAIDTAFKSVGKAPNYKEQQKLFSHLETHNAVNVIAGISQVGKTVIQKGLEWVAFETADIKYERKLNTKSRKKAILLETLEKLAVDNASNEEIIEELRQVIEKENIDRRVFNGREEENDFCESLTNEQVWDVFVRCYEQFMHGALKASKKLCFYMQAFAQALYDTFEKLDHIFYGKIAFIHRYAEKMIGKLSFGVRAVQKGLSKFAEFFRLGSTIKNDFWKERERQRISDFQELVENIKEAFAVALQPAN